MHREMFCRLPSKQMGTGSSAIPKPAPAEHGSVRLPKDPKNSFP